MWAKMNTSATKMACAACLVVAATLPAAGSAAEHIRDENLRLAAITDIDAFSAIPSYLDILFGSATDRAAAIAALDSINGLPGLIAFLGGDPNLLLADDTNPGYDALSAIDVFFGDGFNGEGGVFNTGGIDALANYDALSAIPVFRDVLTATTPTEAIDALAGYDALSAVPVFIGTDGVFTGGGVNALGGYDALSAVDTFFGDNNGEGGVFTGGGIDALAPDADGNGGYAALSALPVFFGRATTDNGTPTSFGPGVFTGGGVDALANYDALSAIPAYLNPAPTMLAAPQNVAPAQAKIVQSAPASSTPPASNPVKTFVAALPKPKAFTPPAPQVFTPPAPPKVVEEAAATTGDNSGSNLRNIVRDSTKATPTERLGGDSSSPFWLQNGGAGVDNGIRGWADGLKKLGIGGGDEGAEQARTAVVRSSTDRAGFLWRPARFTFADWRSAGPAVLALDGDLAPQREATDRHARRAGQALLRVEMVERAHHAVTV